MNITRARQEGRLMLGHGIHCGYKDADVRRICQRLRLAHRKMVPARHKLDVDMAEKIETLWQEKRHAFE